jgi:deoxyadenosine/deoxycytidine kinase
MHSYIAIEGPLGVGKTTLVKMLEEKMAVETCLDGFDNPFLADFYQDKPGAAFRTQMYFLITRYHQQREVEKLLGEKPLVVCDYIFAKDKIYAYLNLDDSEIQIYDRYFEVLSPMVPTPDLVVYLQAPKDVLRDRVRRRNIDFESEIADGYLEDLIKAFDHFFYHYKDSPLLIVNTAEIDFVQNSEDLKALMAQITGKAVRGMQYYHPTRKKKKKK